MTELGPDALVHGACGGAWVWIRSSVGSSTGHRVKTFDLPGSGEDMTPVEQVTLDADAQRVCTRELAVPTALQRRMSSENSCREMLEIDADHSRRLSATDELVAALDRLALGAAEPVAAGAGGCSPSPGPCPTRGAR